MSQPAHGGLGDQAGAQDEPFRLDEATIAKLHAAIQSGRTTCVAVVQHYIERVRAYNGVASLLVTEDGAPVPEATGAVRATVPLRFPTETIKSSPSCPISTSTRGRPSSTAAWRRRPPIPTCSSSSG
jgi:amidase